MRSVKQNFIEKSAKQQIRQIYQTKKTNKKKRTISQKKKKTVQNDSKWNRIPIIVFSGKYFPFLLVLLDLGLLLRLQRKDKQFVVSP